jgi:hypothetical protein
VAPLGESLRPETRSKIRVVHARGVVTGLAAGNGDEDARGLVSRTGSSLTKSARDFRRCRGATTKEYRVYFEEEQRRQRRKEPANLSTNFRFGTLEQAGYVARAVQHAHDLERLGLVVVDDEVVTHRPEAV